MNAPNARADWHPADIVACIRKAGTSLRRLSVENGLSPQTLGQTLRRKWPKGERIIASAMGIPPERIWPSRYIDLGTCKSVPHFSKPGTRWLSVSQIAALRVPGFPRSVRGVEKLVKRENWASRPRKGRGGGKEYLLPGGDHE